MVDYDFEWWHLVFIPLILGIGYGLYYYVFNKGCTNCLWWSGFWIGLFCGILVIIGIILFIGVILPKLKKLF